MKKTTIKLLLSTLVLACTGSIVAMEKTLGARKATEAMVQIYAPESANFEAAKKLINEISRADINAIDSFAGGNLLDLATSRYNQFHDQRYKELMDLLASKGAVRSQGIGGFIPPQE